VRKMDGLTCCRCKSGDKEKMFRLEISNDNGIRIYYVCTDCLAPEEKSLIEKKKQPPVPQKDFFTDSQQVPGLFLG
jgi:hypothetical protein